MTSDLWLSYLRKVVPSWGQDYVESTLASDTDAAASLASALHDYQRAEVAAVLYRHVAPAAFRELLSAAMTQTHGYGDARRLAGSRKRFVEWCRYALFDLPPMSEKVTVYRGSRDVAPAWCARQLSWSLDFDCAAFFAVSLGVEASSGFVVEATVRSSKIIFYSNDRDEREVMLESKPRQFAVNADQSELRQAAERYVKRQHQARNSPGCVAATDAVAAMDAAIGEDRATRKR